MLAHGARPQWQAIIVFVISFLITRIVGTAETLSANLNGNHSSPTMFQGMEVDLKSRELAKILDWAEILPDDASMSQEWHSISQTGSTVPNSQKIPVYHCHFYGFGVESEHMIHGWACYLKLMPFRDSFANGFSDIWVKCSHICPGKLVAKGFFFYYWVRSVRHSAGCCFIKTRSPAEPDVYDKRNLMHGNCVAVDSGYTIRSVGRPLFTNAFAKPLAKVLAGRGGEIKPPIHENKLSNCELFPLDTAE